jgi:8-oxo-dGTP pyrophosphatase MutT (NUDIX family)
MKAIVAEKWLKQAYEEDETFEDEDGQVYWGNSASGVLFVRNHPHFGWQLLMTLRSNNVDFEPNTWGVTGGAIPEHEDSFASALRETMEEIGSVPQNYRLIDEYVWQAPNGTFTYTTYIVEVLDLAWEDYQLNWEVSDARWVSMEGASQLDLHPGVIELLSAMGTKIFGEQQ